MNKVVVLGPSGAGKSVFARSLGSILSIPVIHLDNLWWRSDETHVDRETFDAKLDAILGMGKWILDGDYSRTYEKRLQACDTAILLDYPIELCLASARDRVGMQRDDLPFIEKGFDPEFEEWIKAWGEDKKPKLMNLLHKYSSSKTILVFHCREEAGRFLDSLR